MLSEGVAVEVGPAAEYFEGGIAVNDDYSTSLKGLFAAGESAVSPFGANRVVAATTEMLVSGEIAGKSAAEYSKKADFEEPEASQVEENVERIYKKLDQSGSITAERRPQDLGISGLFERCIEACERGSDQQQT